MTIETTPAGGVVRAFQSWLTELLNDGGAGHDGFPRNLLIRVIFTRTSEGFLPQVPLIIPLIIQKVVFSAAAFAAAGDGG